MASKPAKPSDFCRVCSAEFHIKCGIPESKRDYRPSTENFFRPSQRKECFGVILADVCRSVGITVDESKTYSDRVCTPCARKIRNLGNLYQSIQSEFKLSESSESKENRSPSSPSGEQQSKAGCLTHQPGRALVERQFVSPLQQHREKYLASP